VIYTLVQGMSYGNLDEMYFAV